MKEAIEELSEDYKRKIKACQLLIAGSKNDNQKNRVRAKIVAYLQIVRDLKEILEDEQDKA